MTNNDLTSAMESTQGGGRRGDGVGARRRRGAALAIYLVAFLLLFDQIFIYALSANFGRGGGVAVLFLIGFLCLFYHKSISSRRIFGTLFMLLMLVPQFQSDVQLGSQLYVGLIFAMTFILYQMRTRFDFTNTSVFFWAQVVVLIFSLLARMGFNLFSQVSGFDANRATGLYAEPSHLVYYVSIIYLFSLAVAPDKRVGLGLVTIAILLLNFALTSLIPLGIVIWQSFVRGSRPLALFGKLVLAAAGLVGVLTLNASYLMDRNLFAEVGEQSLTVQVLYYYYGMLWDLVSNGSFLGYGPDRFSAAYSDYASRFAPMWGGLNSSDGSFLMVKLVAEFGLVCTIGFLVVVYRRLLGASASATALFTQYVLFRGFGITSIVPLALLMLCMVIESRRRRVSV